MEFKRDAKRARARGGARRVRARALLSRNEFATWDRQTLRFLAQGHHRKRGSVGCCGPRQNKNFVPYLLHPCALTIAGGHVCCCNLPWRAPICVLLRTFYFDVTRLSFVVPHCVQGTLPDSWRLILPNGPNLAGSWLTTSLLAMTLLSTATTVIGTLSLLL